jgi:hypothetical protein
MAAPSETDQSWTQTTPGVQLIACEEQSAELAELPLMATHNDWAKTAREGIHDRRSRPEE